MTDIKVPASGNIRVWWGSTNAFADYKNPTAAEINACLDISDAVSWNDFDFNLEASNQLEDPAITSVGKIVDRGYTNWGGTISLYYPSSFDDSTNLYSQVYDVLDAPRTPGYVVMRIDGAEQQPEAAGGDFVHVMRVVTDGYAEAVTGEEAFRYTVTMLPQGDVAVRTVVEGAAVNTVILNQTSLSMTAGEKVALMASWGGRIYTNGLSWVSNDNDVVTVNKGVITAVAAGSTTVTATAPNGESENCAITVS